MHLRKVSTRAAQADVDRNFSLSLNFLYFRGSLDKVDFILSKSRDVSV